MFTGLVEETGCVLALAENKTAWRLRVRARQVRVGLRVGDSLAVNGCCLTVAQRARGALEFDLLEETLRRTNLGDLQKNSPVNLERSVARAGRFGGHFVTGHIDCAGTVKVFRRVGKNYYLRVGFPKKFGRYVAEKGSITIDGVSLTIAEVGTATLAVWLIPHTLKATNMGSLKPGARVNLEFDLLAKYAERQAPKRADRPMKTLGDLVRRMREIGGPPIVRPPQLPDEIRARLK
jgi:riboflavin synthase